MSETVSTSNLLEYYARPGLMTDAGPYASQFDCLPTGIRDLTQAIQGLMVHIFWAERYGLQLTEERKAEATLRPVRNKIARLLELDPRPLDVPRPLDRKLVGNCRDFSVLLTSILRQRGVPARARCGFATYFGPAHYEDHWIVEYWKADDKRWVSVDAQLDEFQRGKLGIEFDTCDMPAKHFVSGGKAWRMIRANKANPDDFGIFEMHGQSFVRGNLVRDMLSLNKVEILPWDGWGLISKKDEELTPDDWDLLDRIATLIVQGDRAVPDMHAVFENDPRVRVPEGWPG